MRYFVALLFLTLFSGWIYSQDQEILILKEDKEAPNAEQPEQPLSEAEQQGTSRDSFSFFYERWRAFESAYADGDSDQEQKLLNDMVAWRLSHSIPALPEFARAVVLSGNALATRNKDEALKLYSAATRLDPSLSQAYYSQAKIYFSKGVGSVIPAVQAVLRGTVAPIATVSGRIQFYSKYLLILLATLLVSGFLFALVLLLKYNRLLRHDAQEKYASKFQLEWITVGVWFFLFLPILLFLGPLWLAPFWLMLFFSYCRLPEKVLAVIFLVIYIAAFPVYRRVAQISRSFNDPLVSRYITAFSQGASPKSLSDFENYHIQNQQDSEASILLAYLYKTNHETDHATEILQKHILSHPGDARAYNNLANINFLRGETDSALRLAQRAADLDSENAVYQYNLSKLQRAKFNFGEAIRLMERARRLDPIFVDNQEGSSQEKLIDAIPSAQLVWQKIDQKGGRFLALFKNSFSLVAGAFLILSFVLNLQRQTRARQCSKCGKPFCKKCQSSSKKYNLCTQCLHIFIIKDGVSPLSRKEKMNEIERYSKRQTSLMRLSSLVIPGFGSFLQNRTFFGALVLCLWFFFLAVLLFAGKFHYLSYFDASGTIGVLAPVCIFFLILLYLVANLPQLSKAKA